MNIDRQSSRINVVVVSDYAGCRCGAISGPLKLHLGCGLEWRQKHRAKPNGLLESEGQTAVVLPKFRDKEGQRVFCETSAQVDPRILC